MKKLLVSVLAITALNSCQAILLKLYGVKKPDIENKKSILHYARRIGLDTAGLVTVNSQDFLRELGKGGIPDGAIYDARGKYIEYRMNDTACNAGLFQFIPALDTSMRYRQPDSPSLAEEWKKFRNLEGMRTHLPGNADFYLLLYWTRWTGRLNKDHIKVWEELAGRNAKCRIQVIKVNLDLQEYWEEAERKRIVTALEQSAKKKPD